MRIPVAVLSVLALLPALARADSAGGLSWTPPKAWSVGAPKPMRAATYGLPAAKGDAEGGECAVFHFGAGQGGSVDDNVKRWVSQFEGGKAPTMRKEKTVGLDTTRVELEGTFASGGMMGPTVAKPGSKLLGAIVEGKQGAVFFKCTGPGKTIDAAKKDFDALLKSIKA